ncbi:MAG: hypothetical protein QHH21_03995 [Caldisericota bacterium]|nr:hypothetical protein [Caldisericota bacterium]
MIDLHLGNVVKEFFSLPYDFFSPDVIIDEVGKPDSEELLSLGLQSYILSRESVKEVLSLAERHRKIAINDLFAFVVAKNTSSTLLTGDADLRKLAEKNNVTVHGTLWVLGEMLRIGILKRCESARALRLMLKNGSRLPVAECEKRLRDWER